jgi:NAD(P)H-dependent FMN reductase
MARAAAEAARADDEVEVQLLHAPRADATHVLAADGYLFCTPENLASMAGLMKDFFDRIYYPALDRINGRPYALLVCAGSDGTSAVRQVQRIATGLRLKEAAPPLIVNTQAQTPERILAPKVIGADDLDRCHEIGRALAAGLAAGIL